ncbi:hypothetical protein MRX96_039874 [Rhipicephalus microplus]
MGKDFSVNAKMTTGKPGRKGSTSQFLTVQGTRLDDFAIHGHTEDGNWPKPRPPPKPKAEEPEPEHPRPYEDDPIWEVWESNMLRLTQLLKMLLQELRGISDYTKIDEQTLMAAANVVGSGVPLAEASAADAFATKVAASSIIGGMYNREKVSNALHNPAPFQQLYPPQPEVKEPSSTEHLSLIPLEENVGRLAHNLADVSRAIARPVDPLDVLMSSKNGSPPDQPVQAGARPAQVGNGEDVGMPNRANVSFHIDRSLSIPSSSQRSSSAAATGGSGARGLVQSDATAPLVASVNQLTKHMTQVEELFRRAMGARPLPKKREGLSVSEEEDLRYCISKLTENMAQMSRDLKKTLDEYTVVPLSRLVDDLDEKPGRLLRAGSSGLLRTRGFGVI